MKCQKQLIAKEQDKEEAFAKEIIDLAEKKAIAKNRNIQAGQLAQEYEEQIELQSNQQSLGDD